MVVEVIRSATAEINAVRDKLKLSMPQKAPQPGKSPATGIGPGKLRKVLNRVDAARLHSELLPPSFDLRTFERDAVLAGALGEYLAAIDEMRRAVRELLQDVGSRAMAAAATAFAHIKVASNAEGGLKRTVEKLGARGPRTTVKGTEPAEVPKPDEPAEPAEPASSVDTAVPPADKAA